MHRGKQRAALVIVTAFLAMAPQLTARTPVQEDDPSPAYPVDEAIATGAKLLLGMQEGEGPAEWPYEGVYRVGGRIPYGYRVGGTAIAASALLQASEGELDAGDAAAIRRAVEFVLAAVSEPLMDPDYEGGYDVRGWGHCYALAFLLRLQRLEGVPDGLEKSVAKATRFYIDALEEIEIPENGGWSYSRARGKGVASAPSPFMTAPCLQALFEAAEQGHKVDAKVVERGLDALEASRMESGAVVYAVRDRPGKDRVPGAVGRMLATETTLALAGRGSLDRVRGALDAFLVHWRWLDARRARNGTHIKPYGVAPYYFYYAHYQAALAIEMLPEGERDEYRARLYELLFSVRLENGSWNDRVFERTANYGTSIALLVLTMPRQVAPAPWTGKSGKKRR